MIVSIKEYRQENEAFSLENIGGKALPLCILKSMDFNVPDGFVISPNSIIEEDLIYKSFNELNCDFVAIRSSGTFEDGKVNSWAGQFESFLNVTRENLIKKIKECRDFKAMRNIDYANHTMTNVKGGINNGIAVLVQKMIKADYAGVAFSNHPVTKDSNEIYIEACKGYGDKLVSGSVIPTAYIVKKYCKEIINENDDISDNNIAIENISQLASEVIRAEKIFGYPCDIEWAIENDELFILQCRPITTI